MVSTTESGEAGRGPGLRGMGRGRELLPLIRPTFLESSLEQQLSNHRACVTFAWWFICWFFIFLFLFFFNLFLTGGKLGFPGGLAGKESTCNAGDLGLIPGL